MKQSFDIIGIKENINELKMSHLVVSLRYLWRSGGRRRRRYSSWRSRAGFPWRSSCRAWSSARGASGGSRKWQWKGGGSRRCEREVKCARVSWMEMTRGPETWATRATTIIRRRLQAKTTACSVSDVIVLVLDVCVEFGCRVHVRSGILVEVVSVV